MDLLRSELDNNFSHSVNTNASEEVFKTDDSPIKYDVTVDNILSSEVVSVMDLDSLNGDVKRDNDGFTDCDLKLSSDVVSDCRGEISGFRTVDPSVSENIVLNSDPDCTNSVPNQTQLITCDDIEESFDKCICECEITSSSVKQETELNVNNAEQKVYEDVSHGKG